MRREKRREHDAKRRESRRRISRGAVPSGKPPALDRLASPRQRIANSRRPRLNGVQNRDLALLPPAVAPHPKVELVEAAAFAGIGKR